MDFFKPGSVKIKMIGPNGEVTDLDGFPDFLTDSQGETQDCGCPPGVCVSEDDDFEAALAEDAALDSFISAMFGGPAADDLDDEDFDAEEADALAAKIEAVAQLGRIAEGLTSIVEIHAQLLKELVA